MELSYLRHEEINKEKWDKCINSAFNGMVYAYSWYLDIVSYHWEALVLDDYLAVMPLPGKRKFGINYLFQPKFTQQLGVFSNKLLDAKMVDMFLAQIPLKYKVTNLNLNVFNKTEHFNGKVKTRLTYELDLIADYKQLQSKYSSNTKRNISKAKKKGLQVIKNVKLKDLLLLKKQNSKEAVTFEDLNILRRIIPFSLSHNIGETYGVYGKHNNLVAAAFFIKSHNKSIYLLGASTSIGKEDSAMFLLFDYYLKEHAERNITLDFEGSMLEGLARFYAGFGAKPVNYTNIYLNRLPWIIRFLK